MIAANPVTLDASVRSAAFAFLDALQADQGEYLYHRQLLKGFDFGGRRVPLIAPQGIFKPAVLPEIPLSIRTAPYVDGRDRPYDDRIEADDLILYRYRGTNPSHRDNLGLRKARERRVPLVYFFGIDRGIYMASYPAFIVDEDRQQLAFYVAIDDRRMAIQSLLSGPVGENAIAAEGRRAYVTTLALQRLHQKSFRFRVLKAYRETCGVCRLRHRELLDATHIMPDAHPRGEPSVTNGIALCKLHHAAFDRNFLGIRPDLAIEVRKDIRHEKDGPMLVHGLQGFQGSKLIVPRSSRLRPNPEFLSKRYEIFRRAG